MKKEKVDVAIAIATMWRNKREKYGGVTIIFDDTVLHWVDGERLPDPHIWSPSTYAVYDDNHVWETFGGSDEDGAKGWRRAWGLVQR